MRKIGCFLMAGLLAAGLRLPAAAAQSECRISVDGGAVLSGQTLTLPITLEGNPGVTNLALRLDYDRQALELVSIQTADGDNRPYLCGELAAVNPDRQDENGTHYGYAVCAMPETMTQDGVLMTATFRAKTDFTGETRVKTVVEYLRSANADGTQFTQLTASAGESTVNVALLGDVNGDGEITTADAALTYQAILGARTLTDAQQQAADVSGDGAVTTVDAAMIYRFVNNNLSGFPAASKGE